MAGSVSRRAAEWTVLGVLAALTALGVLLAMQDPGLFRSYTSEEGIVENLTVVALLGGAAVCVRRAWRLRQRRSGRFCLATILLAVLFLAAAGEEISWGQRLLALETPEFFRRHNIQRETNLHNLAVKGVKINKLVFGTGLSIVVLAYCSILPWGYRRWPWLRHLADSLAVPVPRTRHIAWYAVLALAALSTPSKFRWEVLELVSSTMFLLFTAFPFNAAAFRVEPDR